MDWLLTKSSEILVGLYREQITTARKLIKKLDTNIATLSRVLKRLQKAGMIRYRKLDRRGGVWIITKDGNEIAKEIIKIQEILNKL